MFGTKYDVITIGSATRDVLLAAPDFEVRQHSDSETGSEQCFPLGAKIEVKEIVFATGGGGTNAAVTFARQGFKTACVGVIGNDHIATEIIGELKAEGVETKFFQKHADDHTAYSVILVHRSAERTILSYKGEGQHFAVAKVLFDDLKTNWLYIDSLGGHHDLLEAIISHAVKNKIKVAFNPGGKELEHGWGKLTHFLGHVSVYITNREEAVRLTGENDYDRIFAKLREGVGGIIVVSDGHKGVMVSDGNAMYQAGVPDSPVVERTGAGDAFGSGFVAEYMRSGDVSKAIQFGAANASSVVAKFGAKAGILKKGDWGPWPLVTVTRMPR